MLRKIRIILAFLSIVCITLLFIGIGHDWWGWLAKLQFLPAVSRMIGGAALGNIAVVCCILAVTLLCGRIYCSVICPLGVSQDVLIWLRRTAGRIQEWVHKRRVRKLAARGVKPLPRIKSVRKKFRFSKERRWARYPLLALVIASFIVDLQIVVALLGPYSIYGRAVKSIVGGGPAPLLIAAAVTCALVAVCALFWGRAWCNVICPVGTLLGCVSRYQLFGVKIDGAKCTGCSTCERECKAACIDYKNHSIDYSRCVDCFDCVSNCSAGAVSFSRVRSAARNNESESSNSSVDKGRRQFITTGALLVGTGIAAQAQNMKVDGGLAKVLPKEDVKRAVPLVPPGAKSVKNFYDLCTGCQLCVQNCPNGVLKTSTDLEHFLQPRMGYDSGFCRPECTTCSSLCPTGAIVKVSTDEKAAIKIGTAQVNQYLCLAAKGEERCGKCASVCPTGAIMMVESDGIRRPAVNEELCIGCGRCEYLCPSRPVSAIIVNGIETHRTNG